MRAYYSKFKKLKPALRGGLHSSDSLAGGRYSSFASLTNNQLSDLRPVLPGLHLGHIDAYVSEKAYSINIVRVILTSKER